MTFRHNRLFTQNRTFEYNQKKFYQQVGRKGAKTDPLPNARETKQFRSKIWERRDHNRKTEWINKIEKELQGLVKGKNTRAFPESNT